MTRLANSKGATESPATPRGDINAVIKQAIADANLGDNTSVAQRYAARRLTDRDLALSNQGNNISAQDLSTATDKQLEALGFEDNSDAGLLEKLTANDGRGAARNARQSAGFSRLDMLQENPTQILRLADDLITSGNYFLGDKLDKGFDATVGNAVGLVNKDAGKAVKNWTDANDMATAVNLAEDIGLSLIPVVGPALAAGKVALQESNEIGDALSGVDSTTGERIKDNQRLARAAGSALNIALAGKGGAVSKTGQKAANTIQKNIIDEKIKDTLPYPLVYRPAEISDLELGELARAIEKPEKKSISAAVNNLMNIIPAKDLKQILKNLDEGEDLSTAITKRGNDIAAAKEAKAAAKEAKAAAKAEKKAAKNNKDKNAEEGEVVDETESIEEGKHTEESESPKAENSEATKAKEEIEPERETEGNEVAEPKEEAGKEKPTGAETEKADTESGLAAKAGQSAKEALNPINIVKGLVAGLPRAGVAGTSAAVNSYGQSGDPSTWLMGDDWGDTTGNLLKMLLLTKIGAKGGKAAYAPNKSGQTKGINAGGNYYLRRSGTPFVDEAKTAGRLYSLSNIGRDNQQNYTMGFNDSNMTDDDLLRALRSIPRREAE